MRADARFRINVPKVAHETIDGEVLIINLESGNYYSLLGVGADIWSLIQRGAGAADVVDAIDYRYNGVRIDIEKAIGEFLAELQAEGLIVRDEGDRSAGIISAVVPVETAGSDTSRAFEAPVLSKYTDMQDLLVLDPIHEVDESGWPTPVKE